MVESKRIAAWFLILSIFLVFVVSSFSSMVAYGSTSNLIINGNFSDGLNNWNTSVNSAANAQTSISKGIAMVNILNPGTERWHIKFSQQGFEIKKGETYTLSFDAYADNERSFNLDVMQNVDPWRWYAGGTVRIGKTRNTYTYNFTSAFDTTTSNMLRFSLGGENGNVYISNVSLSIKSVGYFVGDVNDDKIIDSNDYVLIKRYTLGIISVFPASNGKAAGDLNGDGSIDSTDVVIMRRYILGIIAKFPKEINNPTATPTKAPSSTPVPTITSTPTANPTVSPTTTPTVSPTVKPTQSIPQKKSLAAGTNLNAICDWSPQIPFKNIIKMARMWNNTDDHGLTLDDNGYPMKLNGKTAYLIYDRGALPSLSDMVGDFVLLYDGEGNINIKGTGISNVVKTPGRITYTNTIGKTFTIEITSINESNYIKNMRLVKKEYESNYETDPFVPNFISRIVNKFSTLRFMDWQKTNDSTQVNWSDRHTPEFYTWASTYMKRPVPVEVMVDLCNRTGSNAWFCMPHLATDDYIKNFATYVKNNLNPELKIYIEFSNECWNWQFTQATWCARQGEAEGINAYQYYGKMSARMFNLWEGVFARESSTRLVRVLGVQAGYGNAAQAKYVMDYTLSDGSKVYTHADALAIAPYFSHGYGGTDNFKFYSPTTPLSTVFADCEANILGKVTTNIRNHKKLIDDKGNNGRGVKLDLISYEGGQHLSPYGQNEFIQLYTEANRDPYMGTLYTMYLDVWKKEGGTLFMNFSDIYGPGKWGMWGVLEHQDQTSTPKYDALMNWIKNNPKWW